MFCAVPSASYILKDIIKQLKTCILLAKLSVLYYQLSCNSYIFSFDQDTRVEKL